MPFFGLSNPQLRQQTADYYNCMSRLDTLIGDLLEVLELSGKADNTIVAYIGDHGADMLRGKRTSYEGGTRVPFIMRIPDHTNQGAVRNELVSLLDLVPTLLELTGTEPIANLPGRTLTPLIENRSVNWRRYLFTEFHIHSAHNYYPQRTVQDDRFKLILNLMPGQVNPGYQFTNDRFFDDIITTINQAGEPVTGAYHRMHAPPQYELYDLKNDPYEFENLAQKSDHRSTLERLSKELQTWRESTKDPMLNHKNVIRLKEEVDACMVDGQPDKAKLTLNYTDYFFE